MKDIKMDIDGSIGGGQILRTSLALSILTGKPFRIKNIRKNRSNSGLRPQHLKGVESAAELCNADLEGAKLNSTELEFIPGEIKSKNLKARIDTAGSIGLLLQTLLLPCSKAEREVKIEVKGGSTFSKWSPPIPYIKNVLLPHLSKLKFHPEIKIEKHGFYPKGGAKVSAKVPGWKEKEKINLTDRGDLKKIKGISLASKHLKSSNVAERQKKEAHRVLANEFPSKKFDLNFNYVNSVCPGSGIVLWAEFENTVLGADSIGEKGKRSEKVGREASEELLKFIKSKACLDKYAGDQIMPFLAISPEKSIFTVSEATGHMKTNLEIIKKFIDVKTEVNGNKIKINKRRA